MRMANGRCRMHGGASSGRATGRGQRHVEAWSAVDRGDRAPAEDDSRDARTAQADADPGRGAAAPAGAGGVERCHVCSTSRGADYRTAPFTLAGRCRDIGCGQAGGGTRSRWGGGRAETAFDPLSASPDQACMHFGAISARSQDCLPIPARDRAERHLVCATPNRAGPAGPLTGCSGRLATAVLCSDDTT